MVAVISSKIQKSYMYGYYFIPISRDLFELYPEIKDDEIKAKIIEARVNGNTAEELVGMEIVLKVEKPSEYSYHLVLPEELLKIMRNYDFPDRFYVTLELIEGLKTKVKIFPKGKVTVY